VVDADDKAGPNRQHRRVTPTVARGLVCALLALGPAQAQAPIDLRVALVIGNAAYVAAPLANPINDAKAMGAVLRAMGFVVVETHDASKAQMQAALGEAARLLKGKNAVGMLYYAGHGLQLDWRNYMVPVDVELRRAADVPAQTIDVQAVLEAFRASGNRMNIVVLDACRDNPFAGSASGKGLAQMNAPPRTLLAYATAPGNVAEDGSAAGGNGLYTQHLVNELRQPGAKIEDVFKRVRLQVRRESEGRQVPWELTSLEDDFSFDLKAQRPQQESWEKSFVVEKADWDRIKESRRPDDFFAYLQKYPSGSLAEQAQFRLDQLQQAKVQVEPGTDGVRPLPSGTRRFALGDVLRYRRIDGFSKKATEQLYRVTSASADRVEFNNGSRVFDQMGGILRNRSGDKDPAHLLAPADIAIGKRWRTAFTNTDPDGTISNNFWEARVVALEDVVVPAGTFKAYRVERQGEAKPANGAVMTFRTATDWIDPNTMQVLRTDSFYRQPGKGSGTISRYRTDELVAFERQPR